MWVVRYEETVAPSAIKFPTSSESYLVKAEEGEAWNSRKQYATKKQTVKLRNLGLFFSFPSNVWPQSFTLSDKQAILSKSIKKFQQKGKAGCLHTNLQRTIYKS